MNHIPLEWMEDWERECGVKNVTSKTGYHTGIEAHRASCLVNVFGTTHHSETNIVFPLHVGFYNVNRIVANDTAEPSKTSWYEVNCNLVTKILRQTILSVGEYHKANTLVSWLSQDCRKEPWVKTSEASIWTNRVNTMEYVPVLRVRR